MSIRSLFIACALAGTGFTAANATDVSLPVASGTAGYGEWSSFTVDDFVAPSYGVDWIDDTDGSALRYTFTIAAGTVGHLTVVDGGFAGDTYTVRNGASVLGSTSAVPMGSYELSANVGNDFDAALADPAFSRGEFTLGAGQYVIGGSLAQSVTFGGLPLDSTFGAVRLTVSPVPEPASLGLALLGLGLMAVVVPRRRM